MICPGCQTLNFRDYKFCRECGGKLEPPAPAQPTMALHAVPAPVTDDAQIQQLLDQAFQAMGRGALADAALACQGALALRPESTAAHSLLGLVYERQGEVQDAIQQYRIVLDLNPTSHADRAKLDALLRQTGQKSAGWWEPVRRLRPGVVVGGSIASLLLATVVLLMLRTLSPAESVHRRLGTPSVRTTLAPTPAMPIYPAPVTVPSPPPPPAMPPPAAGVGSFPRRTMTNNPLPPVAQIGGGLPVMPPRFRAASRPPLFLPPAPIRGVTGLAPGERSAAPAAPARGPVPVLPDSQSPPAAVAPASNAPPVLPATENSPPPSQPANDGGVPGSSINIRRLDGENAPAPAPSPRAAAPANPAPANPTSQASLAEARYHYSVAEEMYRRGDYDSAYREFASARDMFQQVNSRGGTEGVLAAQGALASHRAMQQLAATRR